MWLNLDVNSVAVHMVQELFELLTTQTRYYYCKLYGHVLYIHYEIIAHKCK